MSSPISAQSNSRAGLCPHGLPPSACPICSGGAMGGARMKDSAATKPKPISNQWSYMKCYAAGLAIKAQHARAENAKTAFEKELEFAKQLNKNIENLAQKIQNTIQNIKDIAPKIITSTIQIAANIFINIISVLPKIIEKIAQLQQDIKTFIQQTAEKIVSILGEIKNFIEIKILKNIKRSLKKIFSFFHINIEDENYKNDETLAIFKSREIKKYIVKIFSKIKKRNENESDSIKSNQS